MDKFLASIQVLPWGTDEAEAYGIVRAKMEKKGIIFGNMDKMIATHAITNKAIFVTNDKDFAQVEELFTPVNWAIDL